MYHIVMLALVHMVTLLSPVGPQIEVHALLKQHCQNAWLASGPCCRSDGQAFLPFNSTRALIHAGVNETD